LTIFVEEAWYPPRRFGSLIRCLLHAGQEELDPRLPITMCPNPVEEFVVALPIRLEIQAEIQDRSPCSMAAT
jgi:hypothetical protein